MQGRYRAGLIVGAVGLFVVAIISALLGFCGPVVSLILGAIAGFLTIRMENPTDQGEGAKAAAIGGATAGALGLIGQMIGGIAALLFFQQTGTSVFGQNIDYSDSAQMVGFFAGGLGVGFCFGLAGAALAAGAGAAVGYFATPKSSVPPPQM